MKPMRDILKEISELSDLTVAELKGRNRKKRFVIARAHFIRQARAEGYSLQRIGNFLKRDHTTISSYLKKETLPEIIKPPVKKIKLVIRVPKDIRFINGKMICVY